MVAMSNSSRNRDLRGTGGGMVSAMWMAESTFRYGGFDICELAVRFA